MGNDVSTVSFILNGINTIQYSLLPGINPDLPLTLNLSPPFPGVMVVVLNAARDLNGQDITLVLNANTSVLSGSQLVCAGANDVKSISIQEIGSKNKDI